MTMHQATEPQTTTELTLPPVTPSKSRLLRRYFFPLRKLPENTGCMAELVTTFFPDAFSGTKRKVEKISDYRQHFHKLFKDWGFADLEKEESKSITREEYRAWIDAWRHRELTDLPPDIQVDNWLEEDLANITQHGLSKLGLSIQDLVEPTEWSDILDTKAQNPSEAKASSSGLYFYRGMRFSTSNPLFIIVAESIVMRRPIFHVG